MELYAIPTANGVLCAHFGHCEKFAIVKTEDDKVIGTEMVEPPVHQPGVYPKFLADMGVKMVIAGGMGQRAQDLFSANGISTCVGVQPASPEELVKLYIAGNLEGGTNLCDH